VRHGKRHIDHLGRSKKLDSARIQSDGDDRCLVLGMAASASQAPSCSWNIYTLFDLRDDQRVPGPMPSSRGRPALLRSFPRSGHWTCAARRRKKIASIPGVLGWLGFVPLLDRTSKR
jgi:hypothetical protein